MMKSELFVMLVTEVVILTISRLTVILLVLALKTVFDQSLSFNEADARLTELDMPAKLLETIEEEML